MTQNAINNTASIMAIDNITIDGNTISSTDTDGNIILDPNGTGTVQVAYGTANAITTYGASGALSEVGPLTDGQLSIGSTGNPPVAATLASANSAVTITNGAGTVDLSAKMIQYVVANDSTAGSTTVRIPFNNTIPQNTEGAEIMTITITPTSSSSILVIDCRIAYDTDANSIPAIALFQDTTANALAATPLQGSSSVTPRMATLFYSMAAGTTDATTFKIRGGPQIATTQTFFWNQADGTANLYGSGRFQSRMTIYELEV